MAAISSPRRLFPLLRSQLLVTDGEPYSFREEHARRIAHVLLLLAGAAETMTAAAETAGVLATFLSSTTAVEGHTLRSPRGGRWWTTS
jgi:hypothetical protein